MSESTPQTRSQQETSQSTGSRLRYYVPCEVSMARLYFVKVPDSVLRHLTFADPKDAAKFGLEPTQQPSQQPPTD